MKYHFRVLISVEPDEEESRERTFEKLAKVLEYGTARDALEVGCQASIDLKLVAEAGAELVARARELYEESNGDIEIDDDAAISMCENEPYDWVAAWVSVPS